MNQYTFTKTFADVKTASMKSKQVAHMMRMSNYMKAANSMTVDGKTVKFTVDGNVSAMMLMQRLQFAWDVAPTEGSEPLPPMFAF